MKKFKSLTCMVKTFSFITFFLFFGIVLAGVFYLLVKGIGIIGFEFLLKSPKGFPVGREGGILPAILGTIYLGALSGTAAALFALFTAIYKVYYCKNKMLKFIFNLFIQCSAGIPSIVLGLFGYAFLVVHLKLGRSLISGALTLSLMIFPYIEIKLEKIFRDVPAEYLEVSKSLGVSKEHAIIRLVLPYSLKNILNTITLAIGFAMGATTPIILTGAVISSNIPNSLFKPFMALPYHLYYLNENKISLDRAIGTGAILMLIVILFNFIGEIFGGQDE